MEKTHIKAIRQYHISEVVKRNNEKDGYWVIIDNDIYDLTQFKNIHPGGEEIVLDSAGRDGTREFQRVGHHLSAKIVSLQSRYYIGECIRLTFEKEGIQKRYQKWLNSTHLCTEMYNTLYSDYSFLNKKTTGVDTEYDFTRLKASLVLENHRRFNTEYIPWLIENLVDQFDSTAEIKLKMQEPQKACLTRGEDIKSIQSSGNFNVSNEYRVLLKSLEERDKELIKELRNLFLAGLKHFESYEIKFEAVLEKELQIILALLADRIKQYTVSWR